MNAKATEVAALLCTCPPDHAERLARFLVEGRLAACVNIVPAVTSIYRWKDQMEQDTECLLIIKCPRAAVRPVTEALVSEHPYDLPEVIAVSIEDGNRDYLRWVLDACTR